MTRATSEERGGGCDFFGAAGTPKRRYLAELSLDAANASVLKHFARQLGFDEAGQNRIHAHAGSGESVGCGLREIIPPPFSRCRISRPDYDIAPALARNDAAEESSRSPSRSCGVPRI